MDNLTVSLHSDIPKVIPEGEKTPRDQVYRLELVEKIQTRFPDTAIGGSISIFLHGIDLQRMCVDIDLMSTKDVAEEIKDLLVEEGYMFVSEKPFNGSCDFDRCVVSSKKDERGYQLKIDIKVVENLKYEIIEKNEFLFKAAPMSIIMEAKRRYAENGSMKHKQDLEYIFRHSINRILDLPLDIPYQIKKETVESEFDFPF